MRRVEHGVYGDGSSTTVLPACKAGALFHVSSSTGKFQGTIATTTPRRWRVISTQPATGSRPSTGAISSSA